MSNNTLRAKQCNLYHIRKIITVIHDELEVKERAEICMWYTSSKFSSCASELLENIFLFIRG